MEKHVLAALQHASSPNNNTRKNAEQILLKAFNHDADVSMQCLARVRMQFVHFIFSAQSPSYVTAGNATGSG